MTTDGAVVPATHTNLSFSAVGLTAWRRFLDTLFAERQGVIIDPYDSVGLEHAG